MTVKKSYPRVQIAFCVNPVKHVAQASINVTKPKLACIGTIAALHAYVPFSQHKHTRNLNILNFIIMFFSRPMDASGVRLT